MKIEQGMTRVGRRLIEDFLLPSLNDGRYGDRLKWIDKDNLYFSIKWSHKNAAKWSLEDTVVFQDWDRMKGHFHPEIKGYYMQAKQRFRAALYKLSTVRHIRSTDKQTKIYQLVLDGVPKKKPSFTVNEKVIHVQKPRKIQPRGGIPTSVIRINKNYDPSNKPENENYTSQDSNYQSLEAVENLPPMFEDSASGSNSSADSMVTSSSDNIVSSTCHKAGFVKIKCEMPEVISTRDVNRPHPHIPVQLLPQGPRAGSYPHVQSRQLAFQNDHQTLKKPVGDVIYIQNSDGVLNLSKKSIVIHTEFPR